MHAGKKENTLASLALLHITSDCYIYVCVTGDTGIYCSRQRILAPEITSIIRSFFYYLFLEILADTTFMTAISSYLKRQVDIVFKVLTF